MKTLVSLLTIDYELAAAAIIIIIKKRPAESMPRPAHTNEMMAIIFAVLALLMASGMLPAASEELASAENTTAIIPNMLTPLTTSEITLITM